MLIDVWVFFKKPLYTNSNIAIWKRSNFTVLPKILITCTWYTLSATQVKLNKIAVAEDITIYSDNVNEIKKDVHAYADTVT